MSFMSSYDVSCRLMAFAALAQLYEDVETASGGLNLVSVDTRSGECTVHPVHWSGRLLVRVDKNQYRCNHLYWRQKRRLLKLVGVFGGL